MKMTRHDLLDSLSEYGYPLVKRRFGGEPTDVLENLLRQKDPRLLEGFPVILVNAMSGNETLDWERNLKTFTRKLPRAAVQRLQVLLALTLYLLRLYGMEENCKARTQKLLQALGPKKQTLADLEKTFMQSETVKTAGTEIATSRLKENFRNYATKKPDEEAVWKKRQALEYELLLSELFTARQKELLKKKMAGSPMTKTEKEYFYRVVKKRLKALADEKLHQMARSLVRS